MSCSLSDVVQGPIIGTILSPDVPSLSQRCHALLVPPCHSILYWLYWNILPSCHFLLQRQRHSHIGHITFATSVVQNMSHESFGFRSSCLVCCMHRWTTCQGSWRRRSTTILLAASQSRWHVADIQPFWWNSSALVSAAFSIVQGIRDLVIGSSGCFRAVVFWSAPGACDWPWWLPPPSWSPKPRTLTQLCKRRAHSSMQSTWRPRGTMWWLALSGRVSQRRASCHMWKLGLIYDSYISSSGDSSDSKWWNDELFKLCWILIMVGWLHHCIKASAVEVWALSPVASGPLIDWFDDRLRLDGSTVLNLTWLD